MKNLKQNTLDNELPTIQEISEVIQMAKEERNKDLLSLYENARFQLSVMMGKTKVPLYYIIGRIANSISEDDFDKALKQADFSQYACVHYSGDSLDFNHIAIFPSKYMDHPQAALTMFENCIENGVLIEFYSDKLDWKYLSCETLIELSNIKLIKI